jgi:urea transport system permease protein
MALAFWPWSRAQSPQAADEAFTRLGADSFSDTNRAIEILIASAHPQAAVIIEALADGRLLAGGGAVVVKTMDGKLLDARTGAALASEPPGLSAVRLNNGVRRNIQAALGGLGLLNPDDTASASPRPRPSSSRAMSACCRCSRPRSARKPTPAPRRRLRQAQAAILIAKTDAPPFDGRRRVLRERGDMLVRSLPGDGRRFRYLGSVRAALLLLAAIGLAITFGVMGVINMAHGEMVMLGAYTTFIVQEVIRTRFPGLFDYSLAIALPLAFLVAGLVGIAIERGVIRFLYGRPLETLLATWGIADPAAGGAHRLRPDQSRGRQPLLDVGRLRARRLAITWNRLWIIVFALWCSRLLLDVMKLTPIGLQMRAVTQNRRMASAMGIRTGRVDALTFGLGSGVAGLPASRSRRSTMSAPISARATSSTASWSWSSAASAISGARWSAP